jgi:hypothetical protein
VCAHACKLGKGATETYKPKKFAFGEETLSCTRNLSDFVHLKRAEFPSRLIHALAILLSFHTKEVTV